MNKLFLFTDGSVNTKSKNGFGAYLAVSDIDLPFDLIKSQVKLKRFEDVSSTKLELQTLLWALNIIKEDFNKIIVFTDSQNIVGLVGRRAKLEQNNYYSKNKKRLNNFELYQEFYKIIDKLDCEFIKVCGHKSSNKKSEIDKIFSIVGKASRSALREFNLKKALV